MIQPSLFPQPAPLSPREAARNRREDGIRRALTHAGDEWKARAVDTLRIYAIGREPFLCEQFVAWCKQTRSCSEPPDGRAWGGVFSAARRLGIIERAGFGRATTSNLSPKPLWRAKQ